MVLLAFSYLATLIVLAALVWIVVARPWMLVRPSIMFLGFFWLQVQFAAAVNGQYIYPGLDRPWALAVVLHGFPLLVLATTLCTFQRATRAVADRVTVTMADIGTRPLLSRLIVLLVLIYLVAVVYLLTIPFDQTGLYALLFLPAELDAYRRQSMSALSEPAVAYAFTIMEKVLAPLAGSFAAVIAYKAVQAKLLATALFVVVVLGAIALPTLLYGARGPLTMVIMAALVTVIISNWKVLRLVHIVVALVLCLLPISLISTFKSKEFSVQSIAFHTANIFDRAIGRGHIDNAWHLSYVERNGYHGIAGIEKIAPKFGVEPVDILNKVGSEYSPKAGSSGLSIFGVSARPRPCEIRLNCEGYEGGGADPKVYASSSAGAAFQTLNFAMFGYWSLPLSLAFVIALDLLLYAYLRMPAISLIPVIGATSVPILSLCFSMMTTVLASKGLLLIPVVGWILGQSVRATRLKLLPNRDNPGAAK